MLEKLSNEEIMSGYSLKKIIRYNHRSRLQDESVAEHTCFVSLFCLKIMAKLNLTHEEERQVLILAALHDAAESITSDIPHDVKANYPEMDCILEGIEKDYYDKNWKSYCSILYDENPLIYNILKLADSYSVYQWCLNEKSLGNSYDYLEKIFKDARERIDKYINIINNLINEKEK